MTPTEYTIFSIAISIISYAIGNMSGYHRGKAEGFDAGSMFKRILDKEDQLNKESNE